MADGIDWCPIYTTDWSVLWRPETRGLQQFDCEVASERDSASIDRLLSLGSGVNRAVLRLEAHEPDSPEELQACKVLITICDIIVETNSTAQALQQIRNCIQPRPCPGSFIPEVSD